MARIFTLIFGLIIWSSNTLGCVAPDAAGSISGKSTACKGQPINFSVASINLASSYVWLLPDSTQIISGLGTNSITVVFNGAGGTVRVQGLNSCDTGVSAYMNISVYKTPKINIINPQSYCCDYGTINLGSSIYGSPTGGTWHCTQFPTLINSNSFSTGLFCDKSKNGKLILNYTYADPISQCDASDSTLFTIFPLPELSIRNNTFNQNLKEVALNKEIAISENINSMVAINWRVLKSLPKPGGKLNTVADLIYDADAGKNYDFRLRIDTNTLALSGNSSDYLVLEITIQNTSGCYNKDTGIFYVQKTLSTHKLINPITFTVFPNPSSETINLEIHQNGFYNVQLHDLSGRCLMNETIEGMKQKQLSLDAVPGLYIISFKSPSGETIFEKIVIKQN